MNTASGGELAIAALQGGRFDVVISHIGMLDKDGFELIRRLRSLHGPTPAIALTACSRFEDRHRAMTRRF